MNTFFVAAGAAANGDGSAAHPFATLAQAQTAMENSSTKTTTVEAGTYTLSAPLTLTAADNGETFVGASYQTVAIAGTLPTLVALNGASNITLQGLTFTGTSSTPSSNGQGAVTLNGSSGNTITGNCFTNSGGDGLLLAAGSSNNTVSNNEFDNSADSAIEIKDQSNGNVIDSNMVDGTGAPNTQGGGVFGHGIYNTTIHRNYIENTTGMGIGIIDFGGGTTNSGNTISANYLFNNDLSSYDSGAIYLLGRSDNNTATLVTGNAIDEPAADPTQHQIGIYLDDLASGVTVTANTISGPLSFDVQLHGGNEDTFKGNTFDTGSSTTQVALIQSAPSDVAVGGLGTFNNDTFSDNVVKSEFTGSGIPAEYDFIAPFSAVAIDGNDYFGATGMNAYPDAAAQYTAQSVSISAPSGTYGLTTTAPITTSAPTTAPTTSAPTISAPTISAPTISAPTTSAPTTTSDTLSLAISEDAWQGDAQFTISVDGNQIGGVYTAVASHGNGADQTVSVEGDFSGPHTATVNFLNDAWGGTPSTDRNLYVDGATVDGSTVSGANIALYAGGPQSFTFEGPVSASASPAALLMSEDAWNGDAQFTVAVNGVQVGGLNTETATHGVSDNAFNLGTFGAGTYDVAVTFTNDAWGGTPQTDRNLYVDGATVGGAAQSGTSLALYSGGTQHVSLVVPAVH